MAGASRICVLVLCLSAQHLTSILAQGVHTSSLCEKTTFDLTDEIILQGSGQHNCLCQLRNFQSHAEITIKVTNFTCSNSDASWKLLFLADGCESFVVDCETTWSTEGIHNILAESIPTQLDVQVINNNENSGEIHYSVTITAGTDMNGQCGLPVSLLELTPEEQCPTQPPPTEVSLCTQTTEKESRVTLRDSTIQEDCVCHVYTQQNIKHGVEIHIRNLTCNNTGRHWKLLVYEDDCRHPGFHCEEHEANWQSAVISVPPENFDVYLHLTNNGQPSTSISYEIDISTTHEFSLRCGFGPSILKTIDIDKTCSTTSMSPSQTVGTGSSTTATQPSDTDIVTDQTTMSTSDRNTSSTGSTAALTEDKKMSTALITAVIAAGVVFLVSLAVVVIIIAIRRRRKRKYHHEDEANNGHENPEYSYTRELPMEDKDTMSNLKEHQANGNSGNQSHPNTNGHTEKDPHSNSSYTDAIAIQNQTDKNGSKTDSYPLHDLYAQPNKQAKPEKSPKSPSKHAKHISTGTEELTSYAYYNQIVDDQFGFIHSDFYSGELYSK